MKVIFFRLLFLFTAAFILFSCSSDTPKAQINSELSQNIISDYSYNSIENETLSLINSYRIERGLNPLEKNNYISIKSEEHDNYMITNNVVNHDNFPLRSKNIIETLGATNVAENIAYNYNTPQSAVSAWLNSSVHKGNIEGDFTHFGISIRLNSEGKKYYTNIFVKK